MSRVQRWPWPARAARGLSLGCGVLLVSCSASLKDTPPSPSKPTTATGATLGPSSPNSPGRSATAGIGAGSGATTCAQGKASATPVVPTVWLVVDGSGSMGDDFAGTSRWAALRAALVDPGGVVQTLESTVRFGMVIYNGPEDGGRGAMGMSMGMGTGSCNGADHINPACFCFSGFEPFCCQARCAATTMPAPAAMPTAMPPPMPAADQCATLMVVDPALSNYAAISAAYPQREIGGSTPTHRALERIVSTLPVVNKSLPDDKSGPVYVILATDGAPNDFCAPDGGGNFSGGGGGAFQADAAQKVIEVVTSGVQMGMHMFVISLAGNDMQLSDHLKQVAAISSPGQPPFQPADKNELVTTLRSIIGGTTCQVALDGKVMDGQECTGDVTLNGQSLPCNARDGWRLVDDHTLQLTGTACDSFLGNSSLVYASFPCNVFVPQ